MPDHSLKPPNDLLDEQIFWMLILCSAFMSKEQFERLLESAMKQEGNEQDEERDSESLQVARNA